MIILIGASSDIGKQLLPMLLETDTVLGTARNREKLSEFIDNKKFTCAELDLTCKESINSFCEKIGKLKENITLINLSSISIDKLFLGYSSEEWDTVLNINLNGGIKILQTTIPLMMRAGWGRIINISSVVAKNSVVGAAAYAASKAGVTAMTKTMAHEYGRFGITANTLTLGYFNTGLTKTLDSNRQKTVLERIPSRKFGECKNIFYAIEYIIKSDYLNGSEITIDGGLM
ncbi:SDR family NAD(P)-dependent oxidoreductase [Maridesulfovibrio ferrireducens]|uniref:SDR family NAD(P)-dependent oxidoreductase n=1 Tax=Maridesulfovibrio ferrireducens TaxID=246191 RepID=UPI001A1B441E|nr:SDR family NAD(P)-dependent oxidoreductase [Maridesulfovibrio ferrireducens]MBI9112696.1 SDR family NAD(P)-dependent oxidoreductase [Maridesulfovibrio ferrireducens]